MFSDSGDDDDVLDFRLNFKVTKKRRVGFFNSSIKEETVILNNGKY